MTDSVISLVDEQQYVIPLVPMDLIEPILDSTALLILSERYLKKNRWYAANIGVSLEDIPIETPKEFFWRVAYDIALAEKDFYFRNQNIQNATSSELQEADELVISTARSFYLMMAKREFLPNSPTLFNAGLNNHLNYMACFVLPVNDSIEDIGDSIKWQMLVHKSGGGTGFDFSKLRRKNSLVGSTQGVASGPISFMQIFDAATEQIKQGSTRRGANMAILSVHHADIKDFITIKTLDSKSPMQNFNISVGITDEFMEALENNEDYAIYADTIKKSKTNIIGWKSAKLIWDKIIQNAWLTGDPGVIFIDRIQDEMTPYLGQITATNPCGEQPLRDFEACTLGSINLSSFSSLINGEPTFAFERFEIVVKLASRFLDNVINRTSYPLNEIKNAAYATRRTGLGVMGYADMLANTHLIYGSFEAEEFTKIIGKAFSDKVNQEQLILSKERGVYPAAKRLPKRLQIHRNLGASTIAPTGTISILAGCSSGIEPFPFLVTKRITNEGLELIQVAGNLEQEINNSFAFDLLLNSNIAPDNLPWYIKSSDISVNAHIKAQAIWQSFVGNAVSKTINLANAADISDVNNAYIRAWEENCKGVTIYRDGSRTGQVLTNFVEEESELPIVEKPLIQDEYLHLFNHPRLSAAETHKISTGYGECFIHVNVFDDLENEQKIPFGLFITVGKPGSDVAVWAESLGRTISKLLQLRGSNGERAELSVVIEQLRGLTDRPTWDDGTQILSVPDGVAQVLENYVYISDNELNKIEMSSMLKLVTPSNATLNNIDNTGMFCPDCPGMLVFEEGCQKCHSCGYSEC